MVSKKLTRRQVARALPMSLLASLGGRTTIGRAASAAPGATKVSVALDWYPNADHAGIYLAKARKYFQQAGLDVNLYTPSDPSTVLQTVGAGKDTFGISYQTDILLARAQGVPVVSLAALVQHPLVGVMALASKHVTRPRDLVGKTVGYAGIPSQEAFLATMLEDDGAKLGDVTLVNVGYDLVPAVISGRAAAVMGAFWTVEPFLAKREGHAVTFMHVEQWGVPDYYELLLVANEETVRTQPAMIRAFLGVTQRGYTEAAADQAAAVAAISAASPDLDREVTAEGLKVLVPDWTDHVPVFGTQTAARWDAFAAWMKRRDLIPKDLNVAKAFTTALLPGAGATRSATPSLAAAEDSISAGAPNLVG